MVLLATLVLALTALMYFGIQHLSNTVVVTKMIEVQSRSARRIYSVGGGGGAPVTLSRRRRRADPLLPAAAVAAAAHFHCRRRRLAA